VVPRLRHLSPGAAKTLLPHHPIIQGADLVVHPTAGPVAVQGVLPGLAEAVVVQVGPDHHAEAGNG